MNGACITCSHEDCDVSFHIECARRAKLHLFIKPTGAHIGYCVDHTPLLFKNIMFIQEKREKEEILKTIRAIRRFLKNKKVPLRDRETVIREEDELDYNSIQEEKKTRKLKKTEKKERKLKTETCEYYKFLDFLTRRILTKIKFNLIDKDEYFDRIILKKTAEGFQIENYLPAKKNFVENKIQKASPVFAIVSKDMNETVNHIYNTYHQACYKLHQLKINNIEQTVVVADQDKIVPQDKPKLETEMDMEEELHCICQKPWTGDLMIECERCAKWFHPSCIGVKSIEEPDLVNYYILCPTCRVQFESEYDSLIDSEIYISTI